MGNVVLGGVLCVVACFIFYLGVITPIAGPNLLKPEINMTTAATLPLVIPLSLALSALLGFIGLYLAFGQKN